MRLLHAVLAVAATMAAVGSATQGQARLAPQLPTRNLSTAAPAGREYQLGPGDKVRVNTFGEESLSGEFLIGESGAISLPLVGEVQAVGLTPSEFSESIAVKLRSGFLKDPKVSVQLLTYRPFYILGEVQKPGEYPYSPSLTVYNAVATAGGFTYRANKRRVFIKSVGQAAERPLPLNASTPVAPGDTIRVGERFF